jgi:hypothetical protein
MKKKLVAFVILFLFAGAVFFIGWVQFSVPPGKYGVMVSKTGGINTETIIPSRFRWQWERLLPTNCKIQVFDLPQTSRTVAVEGILPSGDLYGKMLEGNPSFAWKFTVTVTGRAKSAKLPELVRTNTISDQASLATWTESRLQTLADSATRAVVTDTLRNSARYPDYVKDPSTLTMAITDKISGTVNGDIEIISVTPTIVTLPDFALYTDASKTYESYQERRRDLLAKTAEREADDSVAEYLQIERFSRLGEVLTKYPILIDYLAVSRNNPEESFRLLKSIH